MATVLLSYGLFAFYCALIFLSVALCSVLIFIGYQIYKVEDHHVDADWRPVAVALAVLGFIGLWGCYKLIVGVIPTLWHSIPPL